MKKTFKVSLSLLLSFLMLISVLTVGFADNEDTNTVPEEWYDYWNTADIEAGIHFAPGADETQRSISWYASADSTEGYVLVSTNADLEDAARFEGKSSLTVEKDFSYAVTIKDLEPGTKYYYACFADDYQSETYSFTTLGEKDFSAIYVNDIHISQNKDNPIQIADNSYVYSTMLESALSINPEIALILSGGDQGSDGARDEYIGLVSPPMMKNIPFAGVIGNHDRKDIAYKDFFNYPNLDTKARFQSHNGPDYWFVKGDALFLMMDSNNSSMGDHERVIEEAIKANPDLKWRIVVFHHELFGGRIPSREQENELLRLIWAPLLSKYNVDMVLTGHSHHYSMSNVMDGKETKTEIEIVDGVGSVKNPGGPIYLASGSINRPRLPEDDAPIGPNVAFYYAETLEPIFNVIDFTENTLTLNAYTTHSQENFFSFTLEKDIPQSERPIGKTPFYYPILKLLGTIAMLGNNIGKYYDYYTGGYLGDRPFSITEAIFGK